MNFKIIFSTLSCVDIILIACGDNEDTQDKVSLGKNLYIDKSLSANRTMSCATCHELESGLIDPAIKCLSRLRT